MNYVKKYGVGEIKLDLCKTNNVDAPSFVYYTHGLPLLAFEDGQHNVKLSLVFNYENYRIEKDNNTNPFFIAPGYKLNVQKCLLFNAGGLPTTYVGENGEKIELIQALGSVTMESYGGVFTFDDDSQRIIRRKEQIQKPLPLPEGNIDINAKDPVFDYFLQYPDFSKEKYDNWGRITAVYDKYSDNAIRTYDYNENGQLTSITFGESKVVSLEYELNRLKSIAYGGCTSVFTYTDDGTLDNIEHYTGVKYDFAVSELDFTVEAIACENGAVISRSKELKLDAENTKKIVLSEKMGSNTVNEVSYIFSHDLLGEASPFQFVDEIDNNGVETRTQFENQKVFCSYEIKNGEPQFDTEASNAQFIRNVTLYNAQDDSNNSKAAGVQTRNDGMRMEYNSSDKTWNKVISNGEPKKGYCAVSGWIKSNTGNRSSAEICISVGSDNCFDLDEKLHPDGKWKYFTFMLSVEANMLSVCTTDRDDFSMRDLRMTFQETDSATDSNLSHTVMSEYVLLDGSTEIPFKEVEFCYGLGNQNKKIGDENKVVTFTDAMCYKLRRKREGLSGEIFYNNCRNVLLGATDLIVHYNDEHRSISEFDLGIRVYSKTQKSLTRISVDENNQSSFIVNKQTVKRNTSEETTVSEEILDSNLDVVESKAENVITEYVRNSKGRVTRESVSGLYTHETSYTDTLVTVSDIDLSDGTTISTTKYHLDPTWGGVYKVEMPDGSVITDTYDGDMSALLETAFDNNFARKNTFSYSKGNLASMAHGALNYSFEYPFDSVDLESVSKNGVGIEHHTYSKNEGEKTVESKYPSSVNALHTQTKVFDKYGRLESVAGVLENLYRIEPSWSYTSGGETKHTMEDYNPTQHGELTQSYVDADAKDATLSQTTDSLAHEVVKYGYDDDKLTAIVTYNNNSTVLRRETFAYDNADRLKKDCFDYNAIARERVESHIEYVKSEDDSAPDNQVKNYSYKVNGTEKAKTENEYDSYKRVKKKKYTIGGMPFTKIIGYDKTKVDSTFDRVGDTQSQETNVTLYNYDNMDRIVTINDGYPITYEYDIYGQLIREDNLALDKTFVYEYNDIGNIVSVKTYDFTPQSSALTGDYTQKVYTYDATYLDRLVNCGGTSVSYNAMGCPTTYNGYSASWTRGKLSKLSKGNMVSGTHNYEYSYNAFGQRVGRSYSYTLGTLGASAVQTGMLMGYSKVFRYDQSGRLIYESKSSEYYNELDSFETIVYLYDENSIVGMDYTANGQTNTYYFQRNLLGDVVGIYNTSGTKVGGYVYDAWGNCTITLNTNGIASLNPIRYRGYYYDTETGLYYLNARYYSPEWRRFISPDAAEYIDPETPNGLNLYAYCNNDPVNYADPSGHLAWWAIALIVMTVATTIGEIAAYNNAEKVYEQYKDTITIEDGVIYGSSEVTNPFHIWSLSAYVRYYTDSGVKGTSYGLAVEWMYHNIGNSFGMSGGAEVNFGRTIFSDFKNHHAISNFYFPIFMSVTELVTNPFFFIYDLVRIF